MGWLVPMREYPSLRPKNGEELRAKADAALADWRDRQELKEYQELLSIYFGDSEGANG